ncbi:PREDICTED: palmitoyl-protein thioesterase 1-like isoform X2 [Tarenaya hassleriana]|uniref:palmitoyl-protein thioesterase 1-like isoform X2 n=1 Tax=Tarenaya hassleriana TaxID=28532 RepID=UPI0008FD2133|nr:PREDICTED: palmitoyl-protein thioesterase 1-like isoform X2 [Tarenaya hassleriana]
MGVNDECPDDKGSFTELLRNLSGSPGYCVEIGNGKDDSWSMPLTEQATLACQTVKQMKELSQGYNIVAQSQGNMVARGLIEFCEGGPPVRNYVSLGGPHAGVSSIPNCPSALICKLAEKSVYADNVQNTLAPSNYVKIPTDIANYLEHSRYLPLLNNEKPDEKNPSFKDRFSSLQNLALLMFEEDTVLIPKETAWFGYYPDGDSQTLQSPQQTKLYTEDWIGLKTLDTAGKVKFISVAGKHLQLSHDDVVKYVVPYLQGS